MKVKKYDIISHIIGLVLAVAALIAWLIGTNIINGENWYFSIILLLVFGYIFAFIIELYNWLTTKTCEKILYNEFLFLEERKNNLVDFQKFCKRENEQHISNAIACFLGKNFHITEETLEENKKEIVKFIEENEEISNKKKMIKRVEKELKFLGYPRYYYIYEKYYRKKLLSQELIQTLSPISIISFILSLFTTITINVILKVDIVFLMALLGALICYVISLFFSYKKDCAEKQKIYSSDFNDLKGSYNRYKQQS